MPHVIVKLWPGKTRQQKIKLAEAITESVTGILGYGTDSVSVAFEEISASDWADRVYGPDIAGKPDQLFKKPGYTL